LQPVNTSITRPSIEILIAHGLAFCVLTYGGTRALADMDLYRPSRDAFASTMTSLNDGFSLLWERRAALPGDRITALRAMHERGIFTWVSLEPTLNAEHSLPVVEATYEFVCEPVPAGGILHRGNDLIRRVEEAGIGLIGYGPLYTAETNQNAAAAKALMAAAIFRPN
jgi:hypothetical protein